MHQIVVFCGASLGFHPVYKQAAIQLATYFANNKIGLVYGGGKIGMMGILADTILAKKGEVTGVIPKLLVKEEVVHKNITKMIVCKNMSERKVKMSQLSNAYIALPGGFGTLDELFEALTLNQLQVEQKPIGLLNVNGFFDALLMQLDKMVADGFLNQPNRNMLLVGTSVEELMHKINQYTAPKITSVIHKVVS